MITNSHKSNPEAKQRKLFKLKDGYLYIRPFAYSASPKAVNFVQTLLWRNHQVEISEFWKKSEIRSDYFLVPDTLQEGQIFVAGFQCGKKLRMIYSKVLLKHFQYLEIQTELQYGVSFQKEALEELVRNSSHPVPVSEVLQNIQSLESFRMNRKLRTSRRFRLNHS